MTITFHGATSTPTDNGLNDDAADVIVTPPASMANGMLAYAHVNHRSNGATLTNVITGGQTWTAETNRANGTSSAYRNFWTTFNGTWAADPTFHTNVTQTSALTGILLAFSCTSGVWAIDQIEQTVGFTAPGSPFDVSRAGQTPTNADSVTIAGFHTTSDANTWALQTAGWTVAPSAQIRNTQGAGTSTQLAYLIQSSAAATGAVVSRQNAALAGVTWIQTFYEVPGASGQPAYSRDQSISFLGRSFAGPQLW